MDEPAGISRREAVTGLGLLGVSLTLVVGGTFYRIATFSPPPRRPAPLVLAPGDLEKIREQQPLWTPQTDSAVQAATYQQPTENFAPMAQPDERPPFVAPLNSR